MAKLYFDISDDLLFIDGKLPPNNCLTTPPCCVLAMSYMAANINALPMLAKLVIDDNILQPNPLVEITYCGMGTYVIKPKTRYVSSLCQPNYYDEQQIVCQDVTHLFQAYSQDEFYFSIQTAEEIFTQHTAGKLENIQLSAHNVNSSQLIVIKGAIGHKKYLCILEYSDDYYPLLDVMSDDINVYQDFITLTDHLHDMYDRTQHRYLSLCEGEYIVDKVEFDYPRRMECADELLPYALVESYFCGDEDACCRLAPSFSINMLGGILGKFESVLAVDIVPYIPYQLGLVYPCDNGKVVRYFDFGVHNHVIEHISLCK